MFIEKESLGILHEAIRYLEQGFQELPEFRCLLKQLLLLS